LNAKGLTSEMQWVKQMPLNASLADLLSAIPPDAASALAPDGPGTERQGEHRYERVQSADF